MHFSLLLNSELHRGRDGICARYVIRAHQMFVEWMTEGVLLIWENTHLLRFAWRGSHWDVPYPCCLPLLALCTCGPFHLDLSSLSPLAPASASPVPASPSVPIQSHHASEWCILSLAIMMPLTWLLWIRNVQEPILSFYGSFYSYSLWDDFTSELLEAILIFTLWGSISLLSLCPGPWYVSPEHLKFY